LPSAPLYQRIPALVHGISKQSPTIRYPGQVSDATNVMFNVVDGARKRCGSRYVGQVTTSGLVGGKYKMHRITRDDEEKYVVVYGAGNFLRVLNVLTGQIVTPTVVGTAAAYLAYGSPQPENLRFVTVADTTFVCNTLRPTGTLENGASIDASKMPVQLVRTSFSPLTFTISPATWTPRGFQRQVIQVPVGGVAPTSGYFRFSYLGGQSYPANYQIESDTLEDTLQGNGEAPFATNGQTANPDYIPGMRGLVRGKVLCSGGPLPEKPIYIDISPDLDITTLLGFTDNQLNNSRYVILKGDNETQPPPEFMTSQRPISDIGYFRNRLIFTSDDFIFFSAADDIFNVYKERADLLQDSDPIEIQLSANDVTIVDTVVTFRKSVLVMTRSGQQFEVSSGDVFGPGSVAVNPTTKYSIKNLRPVPVGERIYMLGEHPSKTMLYEYTYSDTSLSNVATDVSKHIDNLIPADVISMDASVNTDTICIVAKNPTDTTTYEFMSNASGLWSNTITWVGGQIPRNGDTISISSGHIVQVNFDTYPTSGVFNPGSIASTIYIYRSYTVANERKQSAWSKWSFGLDNIADAVIMDDHLLTLQRVDGVSDSTLNVYKTSLTDEFTKDTFGVLTGEFQSHMDHTYSFAAGTGSYASGFTTFTLPVTDMTINKFVQFDGTQLDVTPVTANTCKVSGNRTFYGGKIGRSFDTSMQLSPTFFRIGDGNSPVIDGNVVLNKLVLDHVESGEYTVTVERSTGVTTTTAFTPSNSFTSTFGSVTAWIHSNTKDLNITVSSSGIKPTCWAGIEMHGTYSAQRPPIGNG